MSAYNYKKAIAWMIVWSFCFTTVMTLVKMVSPDISGSTMIFCRLAIGLLFAMPVFIGQGIQTVVKTKNLWLHCLRAIVVFCSMGCTYYAYRNLPLAEAASIGQTGPLFTSLLAVLILRESMTLPKWVAMFIGYVGVLFIIKPGTAEFNIAVIAALAANLLAGATIIMIKFVTKTDSSQTILFYGTVGTLMLTSMVVLFDWQTPSATDFTYLIFIGAFGMLSQYCYLQALKSAPASFVTPFEYLRLCLTVPLGMVLFGETPDLYTLLGSLIIIASIIFLVGDQGDSKKLSALKKDKALKRRGK
ncbi:DMT family transporter [Candidatus Paracaedibacter symbiosus]|uniref:DMT family transporter n=1 Tax=Candidatus Paracaedibacter symbiosus TaxID=244582 RepID=UPI000509FBB1|nr:DMT family transporter [Candidatus Paracaedibacter symbiosus]